MKKLVLFTAIVMLAVALSAQPMERGRYVPGDRQRGMVGLINEEKGPGFGMSMEDELLEKAGISKERIAKIRTAKMDIEKEIIKLQSDLKTKRINIAEEMMKDNPDEKTIKNISMDMGKIRGEIAFKRIQNRLVLNKFLSKKQIDKLRTLKRANRREMANKMGKRRIEIRKTR